MEKVRVRFAPSPTGPLHIGGVRTAIFNYLFAKRHGGEFVLRIEDTDRTRFVEGAEQYILNSFEWMGITFDEGVHVGGPYGPYRQSERKNIYEQYVQQLIDTGHAYVAFDTPDELEEMRKKLEDEKAVNTSYGSAVRQQMKNALSLPPEEVEQRIQSGQPYVVRFKIPEAMDVYLQDIIRGEVVFNTSTLDDKVLYKSDGMPTYHLANVVDDHLMKITHVIRGEEWLPSLPLHVLLYQALGWESEMPKFAHMPLTLKPSGKGKLSKRDGDKLGFPVFPLEWKNPETGEISMGYRESGYFPDAFINILVFLGWNPGTDQELFSMEELIRAFSLEKINKAGSRFDPEKAKWYNHQYLIRKKDEELVDDFIEILKEKGVVRPNNFVLKVISLIKERATFVSDFWEHSFFFFMAPESFDRKTIKKKWKENTPDILEKLSLSLNNVQEFTGPVIEQALKNFVEREDLGFGQVMFPLRLCLVGSGKGPDLHLLIELLGKEETIRRIKSSIRIIEELNKKDA